MILKKNILILVTIICSVCFAAVSAQIPAFPGAEGDGMYTTGGRGGSVLYVTKLTDDGTAGTLRWAVNQSGARIIMFKVAGTISLKSELRIKNGNLTIAGQSAPGDGICLKDFTVVIQANNVIIRFLRFRLGDEAALANPTIDWSGADAIWGRNQSDIILDHCSMSWCIDECASFYDNKNFTMQWCLLAESLRNSVHGKGTHGYGGIWGGSPATFHHNVLAFHDSRNPRFCGSRYSAKPLNEKVNFTNNVLYNWGSNSGYAGEGGFYNMINNYYKAGLATKTSNVGYRIFSPNPDDGKNSQPAGVWGHFYLNGNKMVNNRISIPDVTGNNWLGFHPTTTWSDTIKSTVPFTLPSYLRIQTADSAYLSVTGFAGASLKRDSVDRRIIKNILNGTISVTAGSNGSTGGFIDSQADVGGWPVYTYNESDVPLDTDNDGMPDQWETLKGLLPNDPLDGKIASLNGNYTNVEVYLNELASPVTDVQYLPTGISNIDKQEVSLSLFPNPLINNKLTFKSEENIKRIQVYTTHGVMVFDQNFGENNIIIPLNGLKSGTYIVKTTLQRGIVVDKVLIIQ